MVELACLESMYTGNRIEGSNPSLTAFALPCLAPEGFLFLTNRACWCLPRFRDKKTCCEAGLLFYSFRPPPLRRATRRSINKAPPTIQTQGCAYQLPPPPLLIFTSTSALFSCAVTASDKQKESVSRKTLETVCIHFIIENLKVNKEAAAAAAASGLNLNK